MSVLEFPAFRRARIQIAPADLLDSVTGEMDDGYIVRLFDYPKTGDEKDVWFGLDYDEAVMEALEASARMPGSKIEVVIEDGDPDGGGDMPADDWEQVA